MVFLSTTLFLCENASNPVLPWYEPMPLSPTPPKPISLVARCIRVSLIHPPPNCIRFLTKLMFFLSKEKMYRASGESMELILSAASSRLLYSRIGKRVIPWAHNKNIAIWVRLDKAPRKGLDKRRVNPVLICKAAHIPQHISDFALYKTDFTHIALLLSGASRTISPPL